MVTLADLFELDYFDWMLEKKIEKKVVEKAKELGFLTYKFTSPSNKGVPDRIFISPYGEIFFIEFKAPRGIVSEVQTHIFKQFLKNHASVYIVSDVDYGLDILKSYFTYA